MLSPILNFQFSLDIFHLLGMYFEIIIVSHCDNNNCFFQEILFI
jgi:hypothetical protein